MLNNCEKIKLFEFLGNYIDFNPIFVLSNKQGIDNQLPLVCVKKYLPFSYMASNRRRPLFLQGTTFLG